MERKKATDFPQELWYLVEDYNHGFISRRDFFERAGKFAVGGLTVAGLLQAMSYNFAFGQQIPKDDARIKAEYAMYPSPNGNSTNGMMRGLLARPANGNRAMLRACLMAEDNRRWCGVQTPVSRRGTILPLSATNCASSRTSL